MRLPWLTIVMVPALATAADPEVTLRERAQKLIAVEGVTQAESSKPAVAEARVVENQVLVIAVAEGTSRLTVKRKTGAPLHYRVVVHKFDPAQVVAELREMLGSMEGVTVGLETDRHRCSRPLIERSVCVNGETTSPADEERLEQVLALYATVSAIYRY